MSAAISTVSSVDPLSTTNTSSAQSNDFINSPSADREFFVNIITDILTRVGRCIARHDWFSRLYENEIRTLEKRLKKFNKDLKDDNSDIDPARKRDYEIYRSCIVTAFCNDDSKNQ